MPPLNDTTLPRFQGRLAVPRYDRSALAPGVVHMSVGGFHRSHQAMYFDELADRGISHEWGITGIGLRSPAMREALGPQDWLYTVVKRGAGRDEARVVGVMNRYVYAPEDRRGALTALTDARTRLVTLTLTGAAYHVDPATGLLDADHPDLVRDLRRGHPPRTALGYLVEALERRRRAGHAPFTVLSCDNFAGNGAMARAAVVSFARLRDERLAAWIDANVAFPSSMVDRITPATSHADQEMIEREFGVRDRWPVITERFSQWVVEDSFCNGRPPLDEVGVQYVSDVGPHALIKTRMLNATHCALGYLGFLAGHRRIDEAVADPDFRDYAERLMRDEVAPLLPPVLGMDLGDYTRTLLGRFANPKIGDQLERLCRQGSGKMPRHVLPSIREARALGRPHDRLTFAVAGWFRYLRGYDEQHRRIRVEDPLAGRLRMLAVEGGTDPRPLLGERALFGDLGEDRDFADELERTLVALDTRGSRAALAAIASGMPLAA